MTVRMDICAHREVMTEQTGTTSVQKALIVWLEFKPNAQLANLESNTELCQKPMAVTLVHQDTIVSQVLLTLSSCHAPREDTVLLVKW
jgi:hypothetical protein